ncbi:hypothetical protein [Blastopirellula marina]|uniref:Uncharacterized protein n=1 Tax=Blastopirellula marina TaxID=124 RepID=A0A2S8F522_9BACT|nr:hypothetical protein [Blastopirellula marina]PQO27024.1 hypothetical protein C5Y98_27590 [Blastopirellula marina]PTL41171.1 hypothetical protein C5Y97_27605 [Blastopirellula marina]
MTDLSRAWWPRTIQIAAGLLVLGLIAGWVVDHYRQQVRLAPLRSDLAAQEGQFKELLRIWIEAREFDGYASWQDIVKSIESAAPYPVFEGQAGSLRSASDAVFEEAIPKLIAMFDHADDLHRQRAWRLLQCASESPRFAPFESSYRTGVAALLRHPSILAYNKLLPWLTKQKLNSPEVLAGLRMRMMDDNDPFAPNAAYTLAQLDPTVDIAPRLLQLIEMKHSRWESIIHQLPKYMPEEEAWAIFEKYRGSR